MEDFESNIFELGEQNILEEFYELIEKHRLSTSNDFVLGDFYLILSEFDLAYQEFNINNREISNQIVNKYLTHCLYIYLVIFKIRGFTDRPVFYAFKRFIYYFSVLLSKSYGVDNDSFFQRNVSKNFPSLWKSRFTYFLSTNPINFNLTNPTNFVKYYDTYFDAINRAEHDIAVDFGVTPYFDFSEEGFSVGEKFKTTFFLYGNEFKVTEMLWDDTNNKFEEVGETYEMSLGFFIDSYDNNAQKLIQTLHLIISGLANIDNVQVEIEDIKQGSLLVKIRLFIKDLLAKEETKAVLETSKEAVAKALTGGQVSHSEVKNKSAETKKLNTEQKLLEKELASKPTDFEAKMAIALNLEKQALENEQLKIKNAKEKLEIINTLSTLVTKGVLEADQIRIDINDILYILKEGQNLQLPDNNIDQIT